jgi:hypothetical protein
MLTGFYSPQSAPTLTCPSEGSVIELDEGYTGPLSGGASGLVAYDSDDNETLSFVVTPENVVALHAIKVDDHVFNSSWVVLTAQLPGAIEVFVSVQDAEGLPSNTTCDFLFSFQEVNHAPKILVQSSTANVSELAAAGTVLLTLSATDSNMRQNLVFSLAPSEPSTHRHLFACNSTARGVGSLFLRKNHLDYELVRKYQVTVRVTDDGLWVKPSEPPQLFSEVVVTIYVTDEEDRPVVFSVTGGSSFGLATAGGEFLTIDGRFFGSLLPPVVLPEGQLWLDQSTGAQLNLKVRTAALAQIWSAAGCQGHKVTAAG